MQFRKEWVVPTAISVGIFASGVVSGFSLAFFKFTGGPRKVDRYLDEAMEQVELYKEQLAVYQRMLEKATANLDKVARQEELDLEFEEDQEEQEEVIIIEHETKFSKIEAQKRALMGDEEDEQMVRVIRSPVEDDWNWDAEMAKRRPDRPYIIHRDEYENEERADDGFTQSTLTYYRGDGILCDESDVPIYEKDSVVGELEFGRGSGDPNVCYVRNERLTSDFEVVLEEGYFGAEVLGQHVQDLIEKAKKEDLKHSVPKFRQE